VIAVFPGSFDPVTLGHLDILKRGSQLFDEIIVAVLNNPNKTPLFTMQERINMLQAVTVNIPNVSIETYSGLLAAFAKKRGAKFILRGVRSEVDFAYEVPMAQANKQLMDELETILLITDPAYAYVSAGLIREIAAAGYVASDIDFDDKVLDQWVSPAVKHMLKNKYM